MTQKNAPGPVGTSCLTCRRRHGKCDMRQPTCLKCEEGSLECLGYSHNRRGLARSAAPKALKPRPIKPKAQEPDDLSSLQPATTTLNLKSSGEESSSRSGRGSSSELETLPESLNIPGFSAESLSRPGLYHTSSGSLVRRPPLATGDYLRLFTSKPHENQTTALSPSLHQLFLIFSRLPYTPSDPIIAYLESSQFEAYFVSYFKRMADYAYFKPLKDQAEQLKNRLLSRLRGSHFTRWVMLLCAKICEDIVDGDRSQTTLHIRWLGDIEAAVRRKLAQDLTPRETEELRGDCLEISLIRTALGQSSNAYVVLRNATPTFLQTAYALPDLWPSDSDPALIPLLNIIGSEHHALSSFTLIDCTCAMIFGLPQQVEYDTSTSLLPKGFRPYEWAHSSPTEFQILLADINACRDKSPRARDWREIEYALLDWQAQPTRHDESWESWMVVAWLAVQESWRLTLLVYLYLSVCGLTSDDPRIQLCVTQILQVIGTVRKHESPDIKVPFFIQYLMVGICARSEQHRKITRRKLSDVNETKLWMIRGTDFVPVLDHLWHGAGSGGRPVTWGDYVYSREALLPVPM
ncbi:putative transcriptional regulatory protein YLR278C [Saccharomyces cerevisiae S288c] [Rhizoctonia solani]|uniref:Putative transcriptional regulatory protein YLR278C [Saccharomyces cerevisiae S288c] n=1 Tax=Rhizoctonia solani TaxID=456999 RepID=A0A0K6G3T8_9AGAM|nr:putative transcriptional regulatory protein YLR278C [Saccharomyces cerevisiae S288c] [Rhizoctonia solani]